jgi:hypothetical protein
MCTLLARYPVAVTLLLCKSAAVVYLLWYAAVFAGHTGWDD